MSDKASLDSNILIYAYSTDEPKKQAMVQELLNKHDTLIISTQTINEFVNVVMKKKMLYHEAILSVINELFAVFVVEMINQNTIQDAMKLTKKISLFLLRCSDACLSAYK